MLLASFYLFVVKQFIEEDSSESRHKVEMILAEDAAAAVDNAYKLGIDADMVFKKLISNKHTHTHTHTHILFTLYYVVFYV